MIKILISNCIELTNSDKIFLKGLSKKIVISYVCKNNNIKNYLYYYVKNPTKWNEIEFTSVSGILRDVLETLPNQLDRLEFLKDMFKDEDIVVLAPGPSYNYLTYEEKKYIFSNYLTIGVKYVIDDLIKNNFVPNFFIYNKWLSKKNLEYYQKLAFNITSIMGTNDNNKELLTFDVEKKKHIENFKLIKQGKDEISWKIEKFEKNKLFYQKLHIINELVTPLAIHLGIKNIYTVGWDLGTINNNFYYDSAGKKKFPKDKSELPYLPYIIDNLKKKNINIYKIKEISPIPLPYYNLFQ